MWRKTPDFDVWCDHVTARISLPDMSHERQYCQLAGLPMRHSGFTRRACVAWQAIRSPDQSGYMTTESVQEQEICSPGAVAETVLFHRE
jgi:hypothetical protein